MPLSSPKVVSPVLDVAESKAGSPVLDLAENIFAVVALLVFSGVLNLASHYNVSEGVPGYGDYYSSKFDRIVSLLQYGIYATTLFLLLARLKSTVYTAKTDPFLWALVGIAVISFMWSDFPNESQKGGLDVLKTTLFGLYFASRFSLKDQLRLLVWALGIGAVITVMYTLPFRGTGLESGTHAGAWRGTLLHKNLLARLMLVSAVASLLVALNTRRWRNRYLVWAVCGLSVALIVLSTSKTALVVFATLIILLPLYNALRWSEGLAIPFFITLSLVGGAIATFVVSGWDSLLVSLGKDPTLSGRTDIWEVVIENIWERPWFGYGYQGFWQEKGDADLVWRVIRYKVFHAHNGFLNIAVELGLVGMFLFVLSVLFTYIRALQWARLGKTSEYLWPITYITFLLMYNYTETTNITQHSLFWVLFVTATLSLNHFPVVDQGEESARLEKNRSVSRKSLESLS